MLIEAKKRHAFHIFPVIVSFSKFESNFQTLITVTLSHYTIMNDRYIGGIWNLR